MGSGDDGGDRLDASESAVTRCRRFHDLAEPALHHQPQRSRRTRKNPDSSAIRNDASLPDERSTASTDRMAAGGERMYIRVASPSIVTRTSARRPYGTRHERPRHTALLSSPVASDAGGILSERRVGRGDRISRGDKELLEKLGRDDPCPCGSGRRFQTVLPPLRPVRRRAARLLPPVVTRHSSGRVVLPDECSPARSNFG
jgi:hypothetical protein